MRTNRKAALERALFHNVKVRAQELKEWFDINLFENLNSDDALFVVRMFLRRHVYEHNGGEVDARYIEESGDTSVRLKQRIRESSESVTRLAALVEAMAKNFHEGFHEILRPVAKPIEYEEERRERIRRSR